MDLKKGKLQIEEGIPNWLLGTIVLNCAAPAITLNVWPRIDQMLLSGFSSNNLGIVLLVTLSALGMTCVPFAMKKAENRGFWWTCLAFGIGLGILNYTMAVGAIGKVRDGEAGERSALRAKAEALKVQIEETEGARRGLPPFRWTTPEMVETAKSAVALATQARDQECNKVGDHCRARVVQLGNRQSDLAAVEADRASTERAAGLDRTLAALRGTLTGLGPIPHSDDQQATRIAVVVGVLFNLGANAAETVASGLIHFLAICAEAFALGMPRIITTALSRRETRTGLERVRVDNLSGVLKSETAPSAPTPTPHARPSLPAPSPRPRVPPTPRDTAPVLDWKNEHLIRSPGRSRVFEVYDHYRAWASSSGKNPGDFATFDKEMERMGVKKIKEANRSYYLEITIKQPLKVVS